MAHQPDGCDTEEVDDRVDDAGAAFVLGIAEPVPFGDAVDDAVDAFGFVGE